jgi:hypothetical protein
MGKIEEYKGLDTTPNTEWPMDPEYKAKLDESWRTYS